MSLLLPTVLSLMFPLLLNAQLLPADAGWVEETLRTMTLEEKMGQLFMPVHRRFDESVKHIRQYHIGGLWFARVEASAIADELNRLQETSRIPLLISADFEKGAGTYVDGATDLPANMALGASRNDSLVYKAAEMTAREARALGVHVNFAPVLDVNNNPLNPVINVRSFAEDPKLVARLAVAAVKGYQENGLLATGKHFPGHGNTSTDTHSSLGTIDGGMNEFTAIELLPYREVISKTGLANIMTAHLWVKALDADTIPATLSSNAMTNLLRRNMGFGGVVYTDAMVMGGITTRYDFGTAVVRALQAGCDVILFPGSVDQGIEAMKKALAEGRLSEVRIDESVRRILRSKSRVGLHRKRTVPIEEIKRTVGTPDHYDLAVSIASECITLVKDRRRLLPLDTSKRILVLTLSNKEGNSMVSRGLVSFPDEVKKRAGSVVTFRLTDSLGSTERASAIELAGWADRVVIAAYVKIVLNSGTVELTPAQKAFIDEIAARNPNTTVVSFGNPYIGASLGSVSTYVCAYDNAKALQEVAAEALCRPFVFKGKLPVTISDQYRAGFGLIQSRGR